MFNLIIVTKVPQSNFVLNFKTAEALDAAREKAKEAKRRELPGVFTTIIDDFGQQFDDLETNIASIFSQCQKGVSEIATEKNVDQARHNEEFAKRRNEDIELLRLFPGQTQERIMGRA